MSGYRAYTIYQAIRLHFSGNYDAIKYRFKTRINPTMYENRRDRYFFEKVAKWFPRQDDLVQFFVANAVHGGKPTLWVGDATTEHLETLHERISSLSYRATKQVKQFPLPFDDMFAGDTPLILNSGVEIELQVVLNLFLDFVPVLRRKLSDPLGIYKGRLDLIENYQPFLAGWIPDIQKVRRSIIEGLTAKKKCDMVSSI